MSEQENRRDVVSSVDFEREVYYEFAKTASEYGNSEEVFESLALGFLAGQLETLAICIQAFRETKLPVATGALVPVVSSNKKKRRNN
jgi:hypothetical protein